MPLFSGIISQTYKYFYPLVKGLKLATDHSIKTKHKKRKKRIRRLKQVSDIQQRSQTAGRKTKSKRTKKKKKKKKENPVLQSTVVYMDIYRKRGGRMDGGFSRENNSILFYVNWFPTFFLLL